MEPPVQPPRNGHTGSPFPLLPIVTADPPRLKAHQKYGGLFYFGIIGLVVLLALVGWFIHGAWSLRDVWSNVYILHDQGRPAAQRVQAAYALSRDARVNQRQRWDICLERNLPDLARYVLAESLSAEAASADPRAYAMAVARSEGWPNWLRLLLLRPMAYAAIEGVRFPAEPLDELMRHEDPAIRLWAALVLAVEDDEGKEGPGRVALEQGCPEGGSGPEQGLACLLLEAVRLRGDPAPRKARLDAATRWIRENHPAARGLWVGWRVEGDRIVPAPAPELH